jgi:predicted nucleic acid-binding protein
MDIYFLDTSALVKRYVAEIGSDMQCDISKLPPHIF